MKPPRYSRSKWFVDRQTAGRDGRSGLPVSAEQPAPTPHIGKLFAEYAQQAAAERELLSRETAPLRRSLAKLTADIKINQDTLTIAQQRLASTQQATTNGVGHDPEVEAWRRKRAFQQLASSQARRQQLEEEIESLHNQYLDRQNQLAAYTWRRIDTYRGRLIQVHPDGELLSEVINEWGLAQLGGTLRQLIEFGEQLIRRDQPRKAIESSESD